MKRFLAFFLLLCILVPSVQADGSLTLPDPVLFSGGALIYDHQADNEYAMQRWYTVAGDAAGDYALSYIEALKKETTLAYAGSKTENYGDYAGVHHYFTPVNANYKRFSLPGIADNICLDVFYNYGGNYTSHDFVLFFSTDFSLSKSSSMPIAAAPTATETPKFTYSGKLSVLQDPVTFTGGLAEFKHDYDKSSHLQKEYRLEVPQVKEFVNVYVSLLKTNPSLKYLGVTINGENVYHCFAPTDGYNYKTFAVTSYGEKLTPASCVIVQYKEDFSRVFIRYASQLSIADSGMRMGDVPVTVDTDAATEGKISTASSGSSSSGSSSSSSSSWSSSSSSSSSTTRTKRCTRCSGDGKVSCSNCSGCGYKEKTVSTPNYSGKGVKYETVKENCYRCHGSGDVDCSSCGGDGKVEY